MNLRWPSRPTNNWLPWYTIMWQALWMPLLIIGLTMAAFAVVPMIAGR